MALPGGGEEEREGMVLSVGGWGGSPMQGRKGNGPVRGHEEEGYQERVRGCIIINGIGNLHLVGPHPNETVSHSQQGSFPLSL